MPSNVIIYEQPLNEHIRVCLRLEHLFQKMTHNLTIPSPWGARITLSALLEMLNVIDRPDLKVKLTKALRRHAELLAHLEHSPSIDKGKLTQVLDQLDRLIDQLHSTHGKLGQPLRTNEFLNQIRQQMINPAGACNFSTPAYFLWLQQSSNKRIDDLNGWLSEFDQLRDIVEILLQLTRQSSSPRHATAENGFFQEALNSNTTYEMVRVSVPLSMQVYPEISVGRHRLAIYFYALSIKSTPAQAKRNLEFELECCRL